MSFIQFATPRKRRSTRIEQAIPLVVHGVGALREPYQEDVTTLSVSCHGCRYLSKHEVIQGDTVYLDIQPPSDGATAISTKAQVKWVKKIGTKDKAFQIAVELETAGNMWGIASPPADWFPVQPSRAIEPAAAGRELQIVTRKEQPVLPLPAAALTPVAQLPAGKDVAAPNSPLTQLVAGLSEQIQAMASEAASAALAKDKNRLLEEFRGQLREEAVRAIQSVISASREVITHQTIKELNEAQEASLRNTHALWRKQIEQDLETARKHMLAQGQELSQQLEAMAASTIDRVQTTVDAARREAVEHFVTRIREQVEPILEVSKDALQRLEGAEAAVRRESEAIFAGIENQLASTTNASLARAIEDLERSAAAYATKTDETLQQLHQNFEQSAKESADLLLSSLGGQITDILQEKAGEVSREFSAGIEGYARNYLESIGKSIAEIPQNVPTRSAQ